MFTNLILRAKSAQLFQSDRIVKTRCYYAIFTALMVVGNAWAEDDIVDIDPSGNFDIFGVFRSLWDYLAALFA